MHTTKTSYLDTYTFQAFHHLSLLLYT